MEEFKKKSDKDLEKLLREKREELRKIRFNVAEKRNPKARRDTKKDIARIMTELALRAK